MSEIPPEPGQSDADLMTVIRGGDPSAYGTLYERHAPAARTLARHLVKGDSEVEDVVSETFTKILDLLRRGGGPEAGFRPYLLTAVRRTVYDRARGARRQVVTGEIETYDPGMPFVDPALEGLERSMIARAFLSLPERWQIVLWHTEIERAKPAEVAPLLGLTANGVAALAYRAREGLRQAYLQMHLSIAPAGSGCRPVLDKLGSYVRGGLAKRESAIVDDHISECGECRAVVAELSDINHSLRVIVGPIFLGPALAGYLTAVGGGGAATGGGWGIFGWFTRLPKQQQAAAAGTATAVAAAALVLALVGEDKPLRPKPPAAKPTPAPAPVVPAVPSAPESPAPASPPTPLPAGARLMASIDPVGALVADRPGIVAVRLRNAGKGASKPVTADVGLPRGVSMFPGARRGLAVPSPDSAGDGWSCRMAGAGARCVRGPLPPGRITAAFLRVNVAPDAPPGGAPTLRITSNGVRVTARGTAGVSPVGLAARNAIHGKVTTLAVGNALLTCPRVRKACQEALRRKGKRKDNDLWHMRPLDADQDATTRTSSSARLELPGKVLWAGLYWSGTPRGSDVGTIRVRGPSAAYEQVKAAEVARAELPSGQAFQAFADVTALIRRYGAGEWWVADIAAAYGVSRYAGWSLVLIAEDARQPYSMAVVLDTAEVVGPERTRLEVPVAGLLPTALPARISSVVWEGDADLSGDGLLVDGKALSPGTGDRSAANVFDSSAMTDSLTFGIDVDQFRQVLDGAPVFRFVTERDAYLVGVVAVSVPTRS